MVEYPIRRIIRFSPKYLLSLVLTVGLLFWAKDLHAQKPKKNKKSTEEYHCSGPGCTVPSHNHNFYVPHKNPNRLATLKSHKVNHKDLSNQRQKNIETAHKNMERHAQKASRVAHLNLNGKTIKAYNHQHQDLNKAKMLSFGIRHKSLETKQDKFLQIAHKSLEKYNQKYERISHRNMSHFSQADYAHHHQKFESKTNGFKQLADKNLRKEPRSSIKRMRKAGYPTVKLSHRDLAQVCYPKFRGSHRDLSNNCYPKLALNHKDLSSKCYPKFDIHHKDLQSKCYPTPKIKHSDLSAECLPKYKVKHENLSTVCYKPEWKIRHQDLSLKCYPTWVTRHKDFENYTCTEIHVLHVPLSKYRVLCDPNIQEPLSTMERIGIEVKDIFTREKLFCKLENRYSGVSAGCLVETSLGDAVVKDYIVKKHTYYPLNLIVTIAKDPPHTDDGEPQTKDFKLTREETKEIMIRELVKRGKYVWLVRMYPEERKNLKDLKELYLNPGGNIPPPDNLNNN